MRIENRIKQVKQFISRHKKVVVGLELLFYCVGILFDLFILYLCSNLTVVLSSYIRLSDRQGLLTMAHFSFFTSVMMGGVLWLFIFRVFSVIKNKEWRGKMNEFELVFVGKPTSDYPVFSYGERLNTIDLIIKENLSDGSFMNHNGVFNVYESEVGEYVDFTETRFRSCFGKIFIKDLDNYLS